MGDCFPLTLALSPIGGEGTKMEPFSCFRGWRFGVSPRENNLL